MPGLSLDAARSELVAAGIAGRHQSHSRRNVVGKVRDLLGGDSEDDFGLTQSGDYTDVEVLAFISRLTGCVCDIDNLEGYDDLDPDLVLQGIVAAARRLQDAAGRGTTLGVFTGHPTGLLEHHMHVVEAYRAAGGKVVRPREEERLPIGQKGRHLEVRYVGGVGVLADWGSLRHTHSAAPMEALLEAEPWPELVLADHGFAGAAIERGIPTIAVMDVNDAALAVAWAEDRDVAIMPMDDNRPPRLYEPSWRIFEAVLSGVPVE